MAIQTIQFRRGEKDYVEHLGTDATGQSVHYIEEVAPDIATGLPAIWQPMDTLILRGQKGSTAQIRTSFERVLIAPNGEQMKATGRMERYYTNQQDILYFVAGFGMPIMMSEANLFVRRGLGFNNLPIWNAQTGQVISYTPEQENSEPTNDYHPPAPAPVI
jgi:hypothetical protein